MQQAQAALKNRDVETAAKEFHAVTLLDPRNAEAHLNLGVIAFIQSDCQTAAQHLRKALSVRPSITQATALLGICERRLGNKSAQALLESSFSKLTDTRLRTQVGMELLGLYYQQGGPERAVSVVPKLVEINPDNVDILYTAQQLYRELADDTLNKLAVLAPGSARMQQVIAQRLINDGDLDRAIEHYRKALEIDPHLAGVRFELYQAVLEAHPSDPVAQSEADQGLQAVIVTEGDSAKVQSALGRIALLRADLEKARTYYSQALVLDPEDSEAQLGLGRVLMGLEKPDEARKYLEMAVKSDPLNGTAHYRLSQAYKRLQMSEAAQKEMHLFEEIKKTMDQVKVLYRQMNSQPRQRGDELLEKDQ